MVSLAGRLMRLEEHMYNGRIYAIRGNFLSLVASEAWRFEHCHEQPRVRPGFEQARTLLFKKLLSWRTPWRRRIKR